MAARGLEGDRPAAGRLAVASWALYDLANTIFSMNIVSLYFSLWVVNAMGAKDALYANATSASMLLVLLTAPALGALSDQVGRRKPFLIVTTVACVALTALLGVGGVAVSLVVFVAANYLFQSGLIYYDALLPAVSTEENRGRVGGLGIGVGYLGSFLGIGAGLLFLDSVGYVGVFRITAALFLVFALPCFLFVREPAAEAPLRVDATAIRNAFTGLRRTVRDARGCPGLVRFLLGRFLYTDPANTIIVFMSIYVTNEIGFSERQAQLLLLTSISGAVAGGLGWGWLVDRAGPRRTLLAVLALWSVVLAAAVAIAVLALPAALFWGVAVLAGCALAGLWAADRPFMLRLAPPDRLGAYYGLYSMVGRFAAVFGPLLWGVVVNTLDWGRPAAVAVMLGFIVAAFVVIHGVDDRRTPAAHVSERLAPTPV